VVGVNIKFHFNTSVHWFSLCSPFCNLCYPASRKAVRTHPANPFSILMFAPSPS